jgi:hypothetical protein
MRNIRVHHNILYHNRGSGILFGVWGSDGPRSDIWIYNNTVYRNGSAAHWAGGVGRIDVRSSNLRQVSIFNNIAFENFGFDIATFDATPAGAHLGAQGIQITTNFVGKCVRASADSSLKKGEFGSVFATPGKSPVFGEPLFADPTAADFRLRTGSPAIGAGVTGQRADSSADLGAVDRDRHH